MNDGKRKEVLIDKPQKVQYIPMVLSFLLPMLVMLIVFIIDGIYPFGDRCFLSTDLYHQYMPFFTGFMRAIRNGEGISYTWNVGVGSNFYALYVYYLASPFHWLGLLVPQSHFVEFLTYLIVCKIGLCGFSAFWYFNGRRSAQNDTYRPWFALFFALGYALSGFLAAYNWNIMWLDCVILLPVILVGLERLVFEQKPGLYCIALALSILTNYYISIMICIFLVLYFIYLFCLNTTQGVRRCLKAVRDFVIFSLLAGGMAAVLLIPEVCAILATDFGDIDFPEKVESYFSVFDMLARHCVAVSVEKGLDHWPNIYCGVSAFLLVPIYALNEKIPARRRFGMLALAGVILLGFSTSVLNFIWHGLNYPDSLPARQSFIYILLVLTMCFDGVMYLDFEKREQRSGVIRIYLGVAIFLLFVEKFAEHEDILDGVEWLSLLFVTIYGIVLYQLYQRKRVTARKILIGFAVVVMTVEVCINTAVTSVANVSRSGYLENLQDYDALYQWTVGQEEGFYRLEKFKRKTKNDGMLVGYPTASVFSSTMNSAVMDLYERLGMRHSKVFYDYDGSTAFTSALLNVNYVFGESDQYGNNLFTLEETSGAVSLYRSEAQLPFGYVAPTGYDLPEGFASSALRLQNQMVYDLGFEDALFENCFTKGTAGDDVRFTADQDGIYYGILTASGTKKLKLSGTTPDDMEWNDGSKGAVFYMGYLEKGKSVTIANNDPEDETQNVSADIYRLNENVLGAVLDMLSRQHLENVSYDSTHLSGSLELEQAGRLILSVPYEKGWTVMINGEAAEPELFGGTFMAFDLEPGQYELSMHYVPYGRAAGIAVTVTSVLGFALICVFARRKNKKHCPESVVCGII